MKKMKKFAAALLALSCVFAVGGLTACKDKDKSSVAIEMDIDKIAITMKIGDKNSIVPTVVGTEEISFTSSDTNVATVDDKGNVTAVGIGKAEITVKAGDVTKVCKITVVNISVSNVFFRDADVKISIGSEKDLITVVEPLIATNKAVAYVSSDTAIVTVDAEGKIKGVAEGSAKITVTTVDGEKKAECNVIVGKAVETITLDQTAVSVIERKTVKVVETITPSDAIIKDVIWTSADESIAAVGGGEIMGIKAGTTTVTATTADGKKVATVAVTVNSYIELTGVNIVKEDMNLAKGATALVATTSQPDNATDCELVWSSSNNDVVSVNKAGEARGRSVGTATLTATSKDDGSIKDTVEVHVVDGDTAFYNKYYTPVGNFSFPVYNVTEVKYNGTALSVGEFTNENNVVTIAKSVLAGKSQRSQKDNDLTFVSAESGDATVTVKMAYAEGTNFNGNDLGTEIFATNESVLSSSVEEGKAVFNMKQGEIANVALSWEYLDAMFAYPLLEQLTFKLSGIEGINATQVAIRLVKAADDEWYNDVKTRVTDVDMFISRAAYNKLKATGTDLDKERNLRLFFLANTVGANAKIKIDYVMPWYNSTDVTERSNKLYMDMPTDGIMNIPLSTTETVLDKFHYAGMNFYPTTVDVGGQPVPSPYTITDGTFSTKQGDTIVKTNDQTTTVYVYRNAANFRMWLGTANSTEVFSGTTSTTPAAEQTFAAGGTFNFTRNAAVNTYTLKSLTINGVPYTEVAGVTLVTDDKGAVGITFANAGNYRVQGFFEKTVTVSNFKWASCDMYDRQITVTNA